MKFKAVLRVAAAALATGALLIPATAPARAEPTTYPPHVSVLYASPFLVGGYVSITVLGTDLPSDLTVRATRGTRYKVAEVYVDPSGTLGTALIRMSSYMLSTTAGRYTVDFALSSSTGVIATTTQTYTVGTATTIRSFNVEGKSYGLYISGKTAKKTPVKITINFVGATYSKTYTKTVKSSSSGYFYYRFYKTTKGTYSVSAQIAANKKYFSESVEGSYTRT